MHPRECRVSVAQQPRVRMRRGLVLVLIRRCGRHLDRVAQQPESTPVCVLTPLVQTWGSTARTIFERTGISPKELGATACELG